jgi:chaperonin GroEL (HSP60 family)
MAAKEIVYKESGRNLILAGVNALADAVKVTLGPRVAMSSSRRASARPRSPKTA